MCVLELETSNLTFCWEWYEAARVTLADQDVNLDTVKVRVDAWNAPCDGGPNEWRNVLPTTHKRAVIAIVTYDTKDPKSFAAAKGFLGAAKASLVESNAPEALTCVLVGVTDVPASKSKSTAARPINDRPRDVADASPSSAISRT